MVGHAVNSKLCQSTPINIYVYVCGLYHIQQQHVDNYMTNKSIERFVDLSIIGRWME